MMKPSLIVFSLLVHNVFCIVLQYQPEISSASSILALRTTSTVSLSKPLCVFPTGNLIDVLAVQASVSPIPTFIGTYQTTGGGASGPYQAARFVNPTCASSNFIPSTDPTNMQALINSHLIRIGSDTQCLNGGAATTLPCNAPLKENVSYRFKYIERDPITLIIGDESDWSNPIALLQAQDPARIITWPGARTGGMVVITTLLVIFLFALLCAFAAVMWRVHWFNRKDSLLKPTLSHYRTHQKNPVFTEGTYAEATTSKGVQPAEEKRYISVVPTSSE